MSWMDKVDPEGKSWMLEDQNRCAGKLKEFSESNRLLPEDGVGVMETLGSFEVKVESVVDSKTKS